MAGYIYQSGVQAHTTLRRIVTLNFSKFITFLFLLGSYLGAKWHMIIWVNVKLIPCLQTELIPISRNIILSIRSSWVTCSLIKEWSITMHSYILPKSLTYILPLFSQFPNLLFYMVLTLRYNWYQPHLTLPCTKVV